MNTTFIKPQWGPLTIALMVLGFVVFWPLGLAMLAYILWGEMFGGSSEKAEAWVNQIQGLVPEQQLPASSRPRQLASVRAAMPPSMTTAPSS